MKRACALTLHFLVETGQIASSHDVATALGFGASAICPLTIYDRASTLMPGEEAQAMDNYRKAIAKSLMKIMGKFGLCTAESYIGGEIFESNYLNTDDPELRHNFPNITSPVGGVGFAEIAASAAEWHYKAFGISSEGDIPHLGLFKERQGGAGHSFGLVAVREYINMTEEEVLYSIDEELEDIFDRFELKERFPEALVQLKNIHKRIGKDLKHESDLIAALSDIFSDAELSIHQAAIRAIAGVLNRNLVHDTEIADSENYTSDIDEFLAEDSRPEDDPLGHLTYKNMVKEKELLKKSTLTALLTLIVSLHRVFILKEKFVQRHFATSCTSLRMSTKQKTALNSKQSSISRLSRVTTAS